VTAEVERLKDLIVELEEVHLRADMVEKKYDAVSNGFGDFASWEDRERREKALFSELDMLTARRIHLLELAGVLDRCMVRNQ